MTLLDHAILSRPGRFYCQNCGGHPGTMPCALCGSGAVLTANEVLDHLADEGWDVEVLNLDADRWSVTFKAPDVYAFDGTTILRDGERYELEDRGTLAELVWRLLPNLPEDVRKRMTR